MALKAVKRVEPNWHTPEDEEDEEQPCRFKIRALSPSEKIDLHGTFVDGQPTVATFKQCFKLGVLEIENAENEKGKPIRNAHIFLLQHGPKFVEYSIEIGAAVFDKSYLTEEEEKNS